MGITPEPKAEILGLTPGSGNQIVPSARYEEKLSFSEARSLLCVGIIDIVNSTKITARLKRQQMNRFYSLFINWSTAVVGGYGGKVVKNMGDSLLFYFPVSENDIRGIRDALNCGIAMSMLHPSINSKFSSEMLPNLNYRISFDYGEVSFATTKDSSTSDIFGVTVNLCSKINNLAEPNTVIIGGDMYQVSRDLDGYSFKESKKSISVSNKLYPIYTVTQSNAVIPFLRSIRHRNAIIEPDTFSSVVDQESELQWH
jgi:class 3 adenylate cyclase